MATKTATVTVNLETEVVLLTRVKNEQGEVIHEEEFAIVKKENPDGI